MCVALEQSPAALRAAFIFQITKFAGWPPEALAAKGPIVTCFVGPGVETIAQIYGQSTANREIDGHPLATRIDHNWQALKEHLLAQPCHLIVASKAVPDLAAINNLAGHSVLLVGLDEQWLEQGGMLALAIDGERLNIIVNRQQLEQSKLRLEPRFLRLAREY